MDTKVTIKQAKAIEAMTRTGNVSLACQEAAISRRQFYRWMKETAFLAELQKAGQDALQELSARLLALSGQAASTLEASLQEDVPPAVRLRAAETVISTMLRLREMTDMEQRVNALEIRIVEGEK